MTIERLRQHKPSVPMLGGAIAALALTLGVQCAAAQNGSLASRTSSANAQSDYTFRDAYPSAIRQTLTRAHAALSTPVAVIRRNHEFTVDIKISNDGGVGDFYNVTWNRLIQLPGQLALYDSQKRYICDLLRFTGGSFRSGVSTSDFTDIPTGGSVDCTVQLVFQPATARPIPTGDYYLQVIYSPCALMWKPMLEVPNTDEHGEIFRSNAIKVTVAD